MGLLWATALIRSIKVCIIASSPLAIPTVGFATTSSAPASRACTTTLEPCCAKELRMTVGVGSLAMILRRKDSEFFGLAVMGHAACGHERWDVDDEAHPLASLSEPADQRVV
jgi:hypothetical protein